MSKPIPKKKNITVDMLCEQDFSEFKSMGVRHYWYNEGKLEVMSSKCVCGVVGGDKVCSSCGAKMHDECYNKMTLAKKHKGTSTEKCYACHICDLDLLDVPRMFMVPPFRLQMIKDINLMNSRTF